MSLFHLDSVIHSLEENVNKMWPQAEDEALPVADSSEVHVAPTSISNKSEMEMEHALSLLFDRICCWQEHSVLATLMSGLANQMTCRSVLSHYIIKSQLSAVMMARSN